MGLTQKVLVLGAIPFGAWGMSRFLRPMASPRARLIAALAYLGLGLSYDALARGRWDGLIAYAAAPWLLARLARAAKLAPFTPADLATSWRSTLGGEILVLAVAAVPALAFAPASHRPSSSPPLAWQQARSASGSGAARCARSG